MRFFSLGLGTTGGLLFLAACGSPSFVPPATICPHGLAGSSASKLTGRKSRVAPVTWLVLRATRQPTSVGYTVVSATGRRLFFFLKPSTS